MEIQNLNLLTLNSLKYLLTIVFFVNYGNFGPVEEGHDVLESRVEQRLRWVEIDGELFVVRVEVQARLQVRDVQRIAYGVYVGPKQRVRRPKHCLYSEMHLLACWGQRNYPSELYYN